MDKTSGHILAILKGPRLLFVGCVAFLFGVFLGSFSAIPESIILGIVTISIAGLVITWSRSRSMLGLCILTIFFCVGVCRIDEAQLRTSRLISYTTNPLDRSTATPGKVSFRGFIGAEPVIKADKQVLVVDARSLVSPDIQALSERVTLTTLIYPRFFYGDQVEVSGVLQEPSDNIQDASDSDGFNYRAYLARQGIYTTMFYPKIEIAEPQLELSPLDKVHVTLTRYLFILKHRLLDSLNQALPQPHAGFIGGILVGDTSAMPQGIQDAFRKTGTSHIVAISGYNITIIAVVLIGFLVLLTPRRLAFWPALIVITLFTILTGAGASVVRAALMASMLLLAEREGHLYDVKNALIIVATIMVIINPLILRYDVGFQLSFLATIGLVTFSPRLEGYFQKVPNKLGLREALVATISAQIFSVPLILYYFHTFSWVSLPANVLVLPAVPYLMATGFIVAVVGLFSSVLAGFLGMSAWVFSVYILKVIISLSRFT